MRQGTQPELPDIQKELSNKIPPAAAQHLAEHLPASRVLKFLNQPPLNISLM